MRIGSHPEPSRKKPLTQDELIVEVKERGRPRWCQTQEQKNDYVRQYKEKEDIDLQNVTKKSRQKASGETDR